ncbi:hypothetical protein BSNK01_03920 [Bacillaceae bacterium]
MRVDWNNEGVRASAILLLIFFTGVVIIGGTFLFFASAKAKALQSLETEKRELLAFIRQNENVSVKEFPRKPDARELAAMGRKLPAERDLPRFLQALQQIAAQTGVKLRKVEVAEPVWEEEAGEKGEMPPAGEGKPEEEQRGLPGRANGADTPRSPAKEGERQGTEGERNGEDGAGKTGTNVAEIRLNVEFAGDYDHLTAFLDRLWRSERIAQVSSFSLAVDEDVLPFRVNIGFSLFYFHDPELRRIFPESPPLSIPDERKGAPIVVIPSALQPPRQEEATESEGKGDETKGSRRRPVDVWPVQKVNGALLVSERGEEPPMKDGVAPDRFEPSANRHNQ